MTTHVAALCLLHASGGQAAPALAHVVGEVGEDAQSLLGRAVMAARAQYPGCSVVDFNVAEVGAAYVDHVAAQNAGCPYLTSPPLPS
jgi:hypothetical protein